jgi:hypothetical protein
MSIEEIATQTAEICAGLENLKGAAQFIKKLAEEVVVQRAQVHALKEGNFTPQEFHNLCHNKEKSVSLDDFCAGCEEYQVKLFGQSPISQLREENALLRAQLADVKEVKICELPKYNFLRQSEHSDGPEANNESEGQNQEYSQG